MNKIASLDVWKVIRVDPQQKERFDCNYAKLIFEFKFHSVTGYKDTPETVGGTDFFWNDYETEMSPENKMCFRQTPKLAAILEGVFPEN